MSGAVVAEKLQRVTPAYPDDSLLRAAETAHAGGVRACCPSCRWVSLWVC
jgi:hypothetical protein